MDTGLWPPERELPYRSWIRSFPQDQQLAAAKLIRQLIYVNEEMAHGALTSAYQRLVKNLSSAATNAPAMSLQKIEASHASIIVTPIRGEKPNVADSGITYMRFARDQLGLNQSQLMEDLPAALDPAISAGKVLVLIDDIIGSGEQLISTLQGQPQAHAPLKTMMDRYHTVACLVVAITSHAYRRLQYDYPNLQIYAGHVLDVESYGVRSLLPIADHPDTHELLRGVAPRLQVSEHIDPIYGFQKFGFTLVFYNCIPDFSLPIFWAQNGKDRMPLKERYDG